MSGGIYGYGDRCNVSVSNQRTQGGDRDNLLRITEAYRRFPIEQLRLLYTLKNATVRGYVS